MNGSDTRCEACKAREKDWKGSDPLCAFSTGCFCSDNYRCATLSELRGLIVCEPAHPLVDYRWTNDQNYATILVNDFDLEERGGPLALWVTWYKSRGRTEQMWLLYDSRPPRRPTEREVRVIIDGLKKVEGK